MSGANIIVHPLEQKACTFNELLNTPPRVRPHMEAYIIWSKFMLAKLKFGNIFHVDQVFKSLSLLLLKQAIISWSVNRSPNQNPGDRILS
jgi:hypothetical protein